MRVHAMISRLKEVWRFVAIALDSLKNVGY
jgi:hypothetical protein